MPLIFGVDPGSRKTGWAFVRQQGRTLHVVESGTIRLPEKSALHIRLGRLHQQVDGLIGRHQPDICAVEDIFTHRNARSALALGQARGVVLAAAGARGLALAAYLPATVKRAVAGHGRADKVQIQQMVQVLLSLAGLPQEDEADAMAVAMCHALCGRQERMATEQAVGSAPGRVLAMPDTVNRPARRNRGIPPFPLGTAGSRSRRKTKGRLP